MSPNCQACGYPIDQKHDRRKPTCVLYWTWALDMRDRQPWRLFTPGYSGAWYEEPPKPAWNVACRPELLR